MNVSFLTRTITGRISSPALFEGRDVFVRFSLPFQELAYHVCD
jgi:hypothetical protein